MEVAGLMVVVFYIKLTVFNDIDVVFYSNYVVSYIYRYIYKPLGF